MFDSPKHYQPVEEPECLSCDIEELSDPETLNPSQDAEGGSASPTIMAPSTVSPSEADSSGDEESGPFPVQALPPTGSLVGHTISRKKANLVLFLLLKYLSEELTTEAEMLQVAFQGYEEYFPEAFKEITRYLYLVFGIEVQKVAPTSLCYALMPALGFTYDGTGDHGLSFPKTILLILVLSVIFLQGNRASEEVIWNVLEGIGVRAGEEHIIYGEPRKFITEDLVLERYLVYQQVPNSDPAHYEFMWGPRAHVETSKMAILEFLARVEGTTPSSFGFWYEEALREEEERFPSQTH
ncbi:melanoma-associated antigen 10-like [Heterocephalus glaber]|uniref:Melanoma-associated antigen 10-like n=1 Tax=Heterocephalus glaber TaxID=10181 RepID=A0AAX6QTH7_HETGA|nr:melanoma-associated antigen 10-like [Heterocephalus glaber]